MEQNVTLNQIAYGLLDTVRGHLGDDEAVDIRDVKNWIHEYRALLLEQRFNRNPWAIEETFIQSISPVQMEIVNSSAWSGYTSNRSFLMSIEEIPLSIPRKGKIGTFTRIGPAERMDERYNIVSPERALASGYGKFNSKNFYAFLLDNKICLMSANSKYDMAPRTLDVRAVWQNPEHVAFFKDVNGNSLYSDESNYPITQGLRVEVEKSILQDRFRIAAAAPEDKVNDAAHTLETPEEPKKK